MKSTLSFFKGKLWQQQQRSSSQQRQQLPPGCASEWDEDAPPAPVSAFPINKNRRVTDGSLLTCLATDATRLTEMTRLSRIRNWRRSRQSGCLLTSPAAAAAIPAAVASEGSALLPQRPPPPVEPSAQPLLLRHRLRRAASEEDWTVFAVESNRRNSISEFDEGVGGFAEKAPGTAESDIGCPTADLMSFGKGDAKNLALVVSKTL